MKRKLTSGLLVLAMALAVPSTFYSCKDTNEDELNDLRAEMLNGNTTLQQALETQKSELTSLKNQLAAITSCDCASKFTSIQSQITELTNLLNGKADASTITAINQKITELENKINNLNPSSDCACASKWESLQTTLDNIQNSLNGKVDSSTLEEAKTELTNSINGLTQRIAELETANTEITNSITTINNTIDNINKTLNGDDATGVSGIVADISKIKEDITDIYSKLGNGVDLSDVLSRLEALETAWGSGDYQTLVNKLAQLTVSYQSDSTWIKKMQKLYGENLEGLSGGTIDLSNYVTKSTLTTELTAIRNEIQAKAEAAVDSKLAGIDLVTLKTLITDYSSLDGTLKEQETKLNSLSDSITALRTDLDALTGRVSALEEFKNSLITGIITQATTSPLTLNSSISLPIGLQSNILAAYYGEIKPDISKFPFAGTNGVANGSGSLTSSDLEGSTSIELYRGDELKSDAGKIYMTLNPSNIDASGAKLKLVDSKNQEAGITLTNVQPSSTQLKFGVSRAASSNGFYEADANLATNFDAAKLDLSGVKSAASDVKQYMKTRTGLLNMAAGVLKGVAQTVDIPRYALQAAYTKDGEDVYVHSNYDIAAMAIHPLSFNQSVSGLTDGIPQKYLPQIDYVSNIINEKLNTIKEKLNIKFTFEGVTYDPDFNIEINIDTVKLDSVSVTKEMSIPVKYYYDLPLFAYDYTAGDNATLDGKTSTSAVNHEYIIVKSGAKIALKGHGEEDAFEVTTDNIEKYKDVDFTGCRVYKQGSGDLIMQTRTGNTTVDYNLDAKVSVEEIASQINSTIVNQISNALGNVNSELNTQVSNMIAELNNQISEMLNNTANDINGQINDVIDELNGMGTTADNYVSRINSYITRVNNLLSKSYSIINNIDYYLKPVMFVGGSNLSRMSTKKSDPTRISNNDAVLYPTTWFVETLNPAYKKFVKVTNVWDANGNLSEAAKTKANSSTNMNTVVDGEDVHAIKLAIDSSYKGYTYEISYAALDYSGYQYVIKYYVQTKK